MRALFENRQKSVCSLLSTTATPTATAVRAGGWAQDATGKMHVVSVGAGAVPAGAVRVQGVAFTSLGAMYVTDTVPGATSVFQDGLSVRQDGAVHVDSAAAVKPKFAGYAVANNRLGFV